MTAAVVVPERFEIWRVFERMLGVLRRNFVSLAGMALLLAAAPRLLGSLAMLLGSHGGEWQVVDYDSGGVVMRDVLHQFGATFFILGVISVLSFLLLQPALLFGVAKDLTGRRATFGEMLAMAVRTALPVLGVGIVSWIAIVLGLCALVIPGIFIAVMLCVAAPARVLEGPGVMRALSRSAELTSGHRWSVFGFFFILGLIWLFVSSVCDLLAGLIYGVFLHSPQASSDLLWVHHLHHHQALAWWNWPMLLIFSPLAHAVGALVAAAAVAAVYFELRFVKEGATAETLLQDFG